MTSTPPSPQPGVPVRLSPAEIVDEYLRLLMGPEPASARRLAAPDLQIRYVGGRLMHDPAEAARFTASRYRSIGKRIESTETVAGGTAEATVVYSIGMLYGEWADGTPFDGNRYVDRYVVRHGLIARMDVWNDSAEWMLVRAGLAPA